MKMSPNALGLLSRGLHPDFRQRAPLVGWIVDLLVVAGHGLMFYWLYLAIWG